MDIILASGSPRRKELLKLITEDFKVIPAQVEETTDFTLPHEEIVENLAKLKARAVFSSHRDTLVIGSDTVVFLDGRPLGKPKDEKDAFNMLKSLSGKTHKVLTGVCLIKEGKEETFSVETKVTFYDLKDEEIREYIRTKEPMDKAGAYGINGHGALFIKGIEGDFYSVVGFPVAETAKHLKNF